MIVKPFISYAREDREMALQLYRDLRDSGAHPWIDVEDLLGGQDWKHAIKQAIAKSSHFIAVISAQSVSKQGSCRRNSDKRLRYSRHFLQEKYSSFLFALTFRNLLTSGSRNFIGLICSPIIPKAFANCCEACVWNCPPGAHRVSISRACVPTTGKATDRRRVEGRGWLSNVSFGR